MAGVSSHGRDPVESRYALSGVHPLQDMEAAIVGCRSIPRSRGRRFNQPTPGSPSDRRRLPPHRSGCRPRRENAEGRQGGFFSFPAVGHSLSLPRGTTQPCAIVSTGPVRRVDTSAVADGPGWQEKRAQRLQWITWAGLHLRKRSQAQNQRCRAAQERAAVELSHACKVAGSA